MDARGVISSPDFLSRVIDKTPHRTPGGGLIVSTRRQKAGAGGFPFFVKNHTDTMETEDILKVVSWLTQHAPRLTLFALAVLVVVVVVKVWRSEEGAVFAWGKLELIKWRHSELAKKLEQSLRELDAVSRKQGQVITFAKKLANDMAYSFSGDNPDRFDLDIQKTVAFIVAALPKIMSADGTHRCAVFVPTAEGTSLRVHTAFGYRRESEGKIRLAIPNSAAGWAFQTRQTYYCKDTEKDPRWTRLPDQRHAYRSILCLPIVAGNHCFGILNIDAIEAEAFTPDDQTYLEMFAYHLASLLAMERGLKLGSEEGGSHAEGAASRGN